MGHHRRHSEIKYIDGEQLKDSNNFWYCGGLFLDKKRLVGCRKGVLVPKQKGT